MSKRYSKPTCIYTTFRLTKQWHHFFERRILPFTNSACLRQIMSLLSSLRLQMWVAQVPL